MPSDIVIRSDMKKTKHISKDQWARIAKYLAGEATEAEKAALESWIAESEDNRQEFYTNKKILEKTDLYYRNSRFKTEQVLNTIRLKTNMSEAIPGKSEHRTGKKIHLTFIKYAAIFLVSVAVGALGYYMVFRTPPVSETQQIVSSIKESPREIILPDGSRVTLNSNSVLSYPKQFTGNRREVKIEGEAYFDVVHIPAKPFILTAGGVQVKVLGTSFNVSAYPESKTVEVVVESGKVQVLAQTVPETGEKEVLLDPGEKATLFKKEKLLTKKQNDDPNFIAWKTHSLTFVKSPLSYVFQTLEKTYQVDIEVSDPEIEKLVISARFKDKTIGFILDAIKVTFNLQLSAKDNRYTFMNRNS